jgi:predicted dehydrogenase
MHARVLARHPGARLVSVYDVIPEMAVETSRELGAQAASSVAEVLGDPDIAAVPAYSAEIGHFLDCVGSGATPMTSFADGVEALRIADAAQESLRSGMPVHLDKAA